MKRPKWKKRNFKKKCNSFIVVIMNDRWWNCLIVLHLVVFSTLFLGRGREDNAMKELRDEIKNVIKIIAQEYVEQYPVSTVSTVSAGGKRLISSGKINTNQVQYD